MNCNNILIELCTDGNLYELRSILEKYDKGNNVKLSIRYIHKAINVCSERGHVNCLMELLKRADDESLYDETLKMNDINCGDDDDNNDDDDDSNNDDDEFGDEMELAIIAAASNGRIDCLKVLLENYDIDIDLRNNKGFSALLQAAKCGRQECIEYLLEQGASLDITDFDTGKNIFHWTCYNNHCKCMEILQDYADENRINQSDDDDVKPIHYASRNGCTYCVESCLNAGANVNALSNDNSTAAVFACLYGNVNVLEVLIASGADINIKTNKGGNGLHCAIFGGHHDVVQYLLEYTDIDIHEKDGQGNSSILYSCLYNRVDCLRECIKHGGNVNDEKDGLSALVYAVRRNYQEIIVSLLKAGANLNFRDEDGWTVLHWAANSADNIECICLLIEMGADRYAETANGETFADLKHESYDDNFIDKIEEELDYRLQIRGLQITD